MPQWRTPLKPGDNLRRRKSIIIYLRMRLADLSLKCHILWTEETNTNPACGFCHSTHSTIYAQKNCTTHILKNAIWKMIHKGLNATAMMRTVVIFRSKKDMINENAAFILAHIWNEEFSFLQQTWKYVSKYSLALSKSDERKSSSLIYDLIFRHAAGCNTRTLSSSKSAIQSRAVNSGEKKKPKQKQNRKKSPCAFEYRVPVHLTMRRDWMIHDTLFK